MTEKEYRIVWDSRLETGLVEVDGAHREFVSRLNALLKGLATGTEADLDNTVEFMLSYVSHHLRDEEQHMREDRYPVYEAHKEHHELLLKKVAQIGRWVRGSEPPKDLTIKVVRELWEWFKAHVLEHDCAYAEYLKKQPKV